MYIAKTTSPYGSALSSYYLSVIQSCNLQINKMDLYKSYWYV